MCAAKDTNQTLAGQTWRDNVSKRIILDNGAYMIKFSSAAESKP